jgi:hypothetical protein
MAKRSRGSARPGQRPARPAQRPARPVTGARPAAAAVRPDTRTADEEARAAQLEADLVAEERAADTVRARARDRSRSGSDVLGRSRTRETSILATRSAEEYTYVVRDVRRIATVGGGLVVVLAALFVLIEVVHVITL